MTNYTVTYSIYDHTPEDYVMRTKQIFVKDSLEAAQHAVLEYADFIDTLEPGSFARFVGNNLHRNFWITTLTNHVKYELQIAELVEDNNEPA